MVVADAALGQRGASSRPRHTQQQEVAWETCVRQLHVDRGRGEITGAARSGNVLDQRGCRRFGGSAAYENTPRDEQDGRRGLRQCPFAPGPQFPHNGTTEQRGCHVYGMRKSANPRVNAVPRSSTI